jgi:hypothetical protein
LEWYRRNRDVPPTFGALALRHLPRLWPVAAAVTAICVYEWDRSRETAMVAISMFLGAVAERLGSYRNAVRTWPAIAAVLDFDRIDTLLSAGADGTPPAP